MPKKSAESIDDIPTIPDLDDLQDILEKEISKPPMYVDNYNFQKVIITNLHCILVV